MPFEHLRLEREGATAVITIDRPKARNALSRQALDELRQAVLEVRNDGAVRVAIVTGAGDKAFVAGADISELALLTPSEGKAYALRGQHVLDLIEQSPKPFIAAINGYALGGGCELAMACTLRVAADTAVLGQPEVKLGLIPGFAGTQRLVRLVGRGRAMDIVLTGRNVDAAEALRIGLVDRVVPAATLLSEARQLASALAASAPLAIQAAMEAIDRGAEVPFREGAFLEAALFGLTFATEDMREGTRAFLEKRRPEFRGK
ncbi:MAG: enoyl-CoA hydratase-related protein [Vicinamibacterales bacterium]